jgi:hypothetical protein
VGSEKVYDFACSIENETILRKESAHNPTATLGREKKTRNQSAQFNFPDSQEIQQPHD